MSGGGELRENFAFDKIEQTANDGGGTIPGAWVEQFTARAGVRMLKGSEPIIAQRLQGIQPVVIKIRSSTKSRLVDTSWRARDKRSDAIYNIRAVTPDAKRAWIEILAEGGVATNA